MIGNGLGVCTGMMADMHWLREEGGDVWMDRQIDKQTFVIVELLSRLKI